MTSYWKVFGFLWGQTATFNENLEGINLKLGNCSGDTNLSSTADSRALGKRKGSTNGDNGSTAGQKGTQAGPSRPKKRK